MLEDGPDKRQTRGIDIYLKNQARIYLGDIPNVARVLDRLGRIDRGFANRVETFSSCLEHLDWRMSNMTNPLNSRQHQNVLLLKQDLGGQKLPDFTSLAQEDKAPVILAETLADVKRYISAGQWQFPTNSSLSPYQLASGLLFEVGSEFMARFLGRPGLARHLVLATEEVLFNDIDLSLVNYSCNRELLGDILPWMIEERDNFSPWMARHLKTLAELPKNAKEQFKNLPDEMARAKIVQKLHDELLALFSIGGMEVLNSNFRAKTENRMIERMALGKESIFRDTYGCRFAFADERTISWAIKSIAEKWDPTPTLENGDYWIRYYFQGANEHSHPLFKGKFLTLVFNHQGTWEIAEIQFFTPEQWDTEERTRAYYHRSRAYARPGLAQE